MAVLMKFTGMHVIFCKTSLPILKQSFQIKNKISYCPVVIMTFLIQ